MPTKPRLRWQIALEAEDRPVVLALSRQALPTLNRDHYASAQGCVGRLRAKGCSEWQAAVDPDSERLRGRTDRGSRERLQHEGLAVRCVSMPSWDLFDALPIADRDAVLPRRCVPDSRSKRAQPKVGIAMLERPEMCMESTDSAPLAPGKTVLREYGFTVDNVCRARERCCLELINSQHRRS